MTQEVGTTDRRRQIRKDSAWPIVLRDTGGKELAHGRTVNLSRTGMFAIFEAQGGIEIGGKYQIEFAVPTTDPGGGARPLDSRISRYTCRVIRSSRLGEMIGVGIEFVSPFV